ncbi:hypothetical protein DSO57_1021085 [Entomophthora muscae]|uniref:Uncharacterized protein n=1 Tax=Entomophthora muscae TaxID=34485 RepID=A0ACC2TEJ0_9FUNG|nr:hypothetical protein DSO57_1021085 [Entomophthora muscae]
MITPKIHKHAPVEKDILQRREKMLIFPPLPVHILQQLIQHSPRFYQSWDFIDSCESVKEYTLLRPYFTLST